MNKFTYTITVFNEEAINDVAIRLGECQHYSDKINDQMLSDNRVDKEHDHLNFFQLLRILKKRNNMDTSVCFYCVQKNGLFHIFSNFFNLTDAFSEVFHFFDDINPILMLCERNNNSICFHLIRRGKILFTHTLEFSENGLLNCAVWRKHYTELLCKINEMPNVADIEASLDFIIHNSICSDYQMYQYLEKNAIFKDEYIL